MVALPGEMDAKQHPSNPSHPLPEAGNNQCTRRGKSACSPPAPRLRTPDSQSRFLSFFFQPWDLRFGQGDRGRWLETLGVLTAGLSRLLGTGQMWAKLS